ncbi:uncharacterized protein LOC121253365 [Juglans microcarpa x Juglans regia]|uniref:uncharacterized protein LOC121253365 n=1 Tax=Juglans microcarpa x Juglans regia TaxID=2249226 RepID=UPI001B7E5A74|nr:uncharacterized protein LOC121253365 [Juglans microcarpa x Juglans regia]
MHLRVVEDNEEALDQSLNLKKATMFFSFNTKLSTRLSIKNVVGVSICGNYERYLGLPAMVRRSKFNIFISLKERVWAKISNWNNSFLSQAGVWISCSREDKWEMLDIFWVKANWDASVNASLKKVDIGVVLRDDEGEVLASLCFVVDYLQNPSIGEASELRRAILLCGELVFLKIVLEGDSQVIVKAANSSESLFADYGNVVDEVRGLLKTRVD